MNGRRIYHARGKVLGGSSSINGMIFQRGNPLDFERWAADPGMESWSYAHCLPYFKRMETCLAGADEFRGGSGPLVLERGPRPIRCSVRSSKPCSRPGYELTDDVNGYRQEGFARFDRNIQRGRRLSAAGAYLHPVMRRPNLDVKTRALTTKIVFEGSRAVGVEYTTKRNRNVERAMGGEIICCGGAFNSPQLLQLSGVGNATDLDRARHRRGARPGRRRRAHAGSPRGVHPAPKHAAGVDGADDRQVAPTVDRLAVAGAARARRDEPLRGGRLRAQQRRARLPQRDVPLPADRDSLRRLDAGRWARARLPGARGADVLQLARFGEDPFARSPGEAGAALQLPVDGRGPDGVGRDGARRAPDPRPARVRAVQRR